MKNKHIPLMLLPDRLALALGRNILGVGKFLNKITHGLKYDLKEADLEYHEEEYAALCFVNSLVWGGLLVGLISLIGFLQDKQTGILLTIILGLGLTFLMFFVFIRYPKILAGKKAEEVDKNLIFAFKDMLLQISSGVSLDNSLINIAQSNYGQVSKECQKCIQDLHKGDSFEHALEAMAGRTKTEYFRRAIWQIINTNKSGASLEETLKSIINELLTEHKNKINNYSKELNLWSLLYMLFAVAIPTIGATMLVVLSSFAGFSVTPTTFISFIAITVFIQVIIIGLIKSRRPIVQI